MKTLGLHYLCTLMMIAVPAFDAGVAFVLSPSFPPAPPPPNRRPPICCFQIVPQHTRDCFWVAFQIAANMGTGASFGLLRVTLAVFYLFPHITLGVSRIPSSPERASGC